MVPLRTIHLAGFPFRVYASPRPVPDHPWASFTDLAALTQLSEADRGRWLQDLLRMAPDMLHRLLDRTMLIAEPLVGGGFRAWIVHGHSSIQSFLDQWTMTWVELFAAPNAHLPRDQWQQVIREAGLRNLPTLPDTTPVQ